MSEATDLNDEIQTLEKEIREQHERLNAMRLAQPPEPVEDFVLKGPDDADVPLSSLFGDKKDLVVIHNMGSQCPYCTLWADGFQGVIQHLQDRAAFVLVSPDTPENQVKFAFSRGWRFPMASNGDSGFTEAMGYTKTHEGTTYMLPGYSTFRLQDDGSIQRIAHASFGPGDPYCGVWHIFGLLDGGVGEWQPNFQYL